MLGGAILYFWSYHPLKRDNSDSMEHKWIFYLILVQ